LIGIITPLLLKPALDEAHLANLEQLTIFGTVKWELLAAIINFIIVAFDTFSFNKGMNRALKEKKSKVAPATPPELSTSEKLLVGNKRFFEKV